MISPTDLLTQFAVNIITTIFGVQDQSEENDDEIDDDFDEVFDNPDKHLHRRNGNNNVLEELTRKKIVTRWLEGEQRDKIAAGMELGAGTLSAIVSEWKVEIGIPTADSLRHFSTELRRLGVTASQCVLGCRILGVLGKIGIDEENLESFAFHLYQSCQRKDIMPEAIVECSQEILSLSKTEKIPISRIPQYVEKMIAGRYCLLEQYC